ncbi:MAG: rod shape-determining protein MreC [Bacteroidales bacterium]|jgi:rod shape-determining protein MreC|nr:rod shape-determining protein MreC [Bacteroidales bacterium]MCI1784942.1 rod shape-determining protein MreC [Bacteroidales bacterium]
MHGKSKIISTLANAAVFIILEIVAMHILGNNDTLQGIKVNEGIHTFMAKAWGGSEAMRRYLSLGKENDELANANFLLEQQIRKYEYASDSSYAGATASSIEKVDGFEYIPASIVKISRNKQHNYIIIGKGSEDGIRPKSGIITKNGIIGIIDAVGKKYSYAFSFMNSEITISSRIGKQGPIGPLIWNGKTSNGAILKEIPLQYKFNPGDTVYSSGFSSIFPSDIPLGEIVSSRIMNGATYEIKIKLFQDFSSLRYVSVVRNTGTHEIEELEQKENGAGAEKK